MSGRFLIYFFLTLPIYFGLLFWVVNPLLKKFAVRVQGAAFSYRLRPTEPTNTPGKLAKYDYYWSAVATMLAFLLSVMPFGIIEETGLGIRWFGM